MTGHRQDDFQESQFYRVVAGGSVALSMFILAATVAVASDHARPPPLLLPPFKVGQELSFEFTMTEHDRNADSQFSESTLQEAFDIKILAVTSKEARLVWTLHDAAGTGEFGWGPQYFAALKGVPVELRTDASGYPRSIANWYTLKESLS